MPAFLERALSKSGRKHGFSGRRLARYVYGGMNTIGAMHGNKETAKGEAMDAKHAAKKPHVYRRLAGR
jgi:hypothetical protein